MKSLKNWPRYWRKDLVAWANAWPRPVWKRRHSLHILLQSKFNLNYHYDYWSRGLYISYWDIVIRRQRYGKIATLNKVIRDDIPSLVWRCGVLWWHILSYLPMVKNHLINYWVQIGIRIWIILEEDRAMDIILLVSKIKSIGAIVFELRIRTDIQTDPNALPSYSVQGARVKLKSVSRTIKKIQEHPSRTFKEEHSRIFWGEHSRTFGGEHSINNNNNIPRTIKKKHSRTLKDGVN